MYTPLITREKRLYLPVISIFIFVVITKSTPDVKIIRTIMIDENSRNIRPKEGDIIVH